MDAEFVEAFVEEWQAAWNSHDIDRVLASETYALRHRVLGRGRTPADVATDDDADPDSGHFAGRVDGAVVATGTVRRRPGPAGEDPAWQIRGMAVEAHLRGNGLGSALLAALIDHVHEHGGGLIWCHARLASCRLYERKGFAAVGDPFEDPVAGTQVLMTLPVPPA